MDAPGSKAWLDHLEAWLAPFLAARRRAEQRRRAPLHRSGLSPGERNSVEPMAARAAPGHVDHLHHFVFASPCPYARLERVMAEQADRLVGGPQAVLGFKPSVVAT